MSEQKNNTPAIIDLGVIIRKIRTNWKTFIKPLAIVFVLSCFYIVSIPRYYTTEAKMAPELGGDLGGGTLGSLAASFGFNLGDMQTNDAITPLLYPDLLDDNGFIASLFSIKVQTLEGDVSSDYYSYLEKYQKQPWWGSFTNWVSSLIPKSEDKTGTGNGTFDPYNLNRKQNGMVKLIKTNIGMSVDKKTGVITLSVVDQDPKICRTLADSVMERLQAFITDYRTNKARIDVNYYTALADSAKAEYEQAARAYSLFVDSHTNVVLESIRSRQNDLENEMQLKYNTYSAINTQLQAARGKVQERTPAFTILKGAAIPVKPAGPKRMIFVIGMMILATIITSVYIVMKK